MLRSTPTLRDSIKIFLAIVILAGVSPTAEALELSPADIKGKDVEKPITVLQRRFFKKAFRPEIGLLQGTMLNEAYTKTETRGLRASLFVTEWIGAEVQYIDTSVTSSADRRSLNKKKYKPADPEPGHEDDIVTPDVDINKIHSFMDLNAVIVPFYGKLNLFDTAIIYIDTYVNVGASKVATDQGDKNAILFGVGQRFYVWRSLSFRVDFRDHIFTEKRGTANTTKNGYSVDIGASYFFL